MSKKDKVKKEKLTQHSFPQEIVVTLDDEVKEDDEPLLLAHRSADDVAEIGIEKTVAVYTLQRVVKVTVETTIVETSVGNYDDFEA